MATTGGLSKLVSDELAMLSAAAGIVGFREDLTTLERAKLLHARLAGGAA